MTLLGTLFGFEGRINRSTFWLCAISVGLLDAALWLATDSWVQRTYPGAAALANPGAGVLAVGLPLLVAAVVSVWAALALKVKRLHDRDRSGFWLLAFLIPVLGPLWLFWELALAPGKPKGERFDKGAARAATHDGPAPGDGTGWIAPAALAATAGGMAFAATQAAHAGESHHPASQSDIAPDSGYGVIAPSHVEPAAEAPVEPAGQIAIPAEDAPPTPVEPVAETEPYTQAEAAQVTQAQIADYLASVDHDMPPPAPAEPVHEPEPEAPVAAAEDAPQAHHEAPAQHPAPAPVEASQDTTYHSLAVPEPALEAPLEPPAPPPSDGHDHHPPH